MHACHMPGTCTVYSRPSQRLAGVQGVPGWELLQIHPAESPAFFLLDGVDGLAHHGLRHAVASCPGHPPDYRDLIGPSPSLQYYYWVLPSPLPCSARPQMSRSRTRSILTSASLDATFQGQTSSNFVCLLGSAIDRPGLVALGAGLSNLLPSHTPSPHLRLSLMCLPSPPSCFLQPLHLFATLAFSRLSLGPDYFLIRDGAREKSRSLL